MTGGVGLPELAGQIIELLRGIDRVGERVDKHLRPTKTRRAAASVASMLGA
jgi:hypothetical protein